MLERFIDNIKKYKLIEKSDTIVLGLSGGYDSQVLFKLLLEIKDDWDLKIIVTHINHMIRDKADEDQAFVEDLARKNNIEYRSLKMDMKKYALENALSEEDAGRRIRYNFFRKVKEEFSAKSIAVAHNKDDQAETVLMNLMRGAGLDGLSGMDYKNGDIIRPILNFSREEIESYAREKGIVPREDFTNSLAIYRRNSIRLELLPFIEEKYNPSIKNAIFSMSEIIKDQLGIINDVTFKTFESVLSSQTDDFICLKLSLLEKVDRPLRLNIYRFVIGKILASLDGFERAHYLEIDKLLGAKRSAFVAINGIRVTKDYEDIVFEIQKEEKDGQDQVISGPGTYIFYNKLFKVTYVSKDEINFSKTENIEYFDKRLIEKLEIRSRKDGDRIEPIGFSGSKKIKDLLIDSKIPKRYRDKFPILTDGEKILWLVGLRRSRHYLVKSDSEEVIKIEVIDCEKDYR